MAVVAFEHPDPIVPWSFTLFLIVVVFSGAAATAVGVGGVFIMPCLLWLGAEPKVAALSTLASYILHSVLNSAIYIRRGLVPKKATVVAVCAVFPSALLALFLLQYVPPIVLSVIVSCIALYSGVENLCKEYLKHRRRKRIHRATVADISSVPPGEVTPENSGESAGEDIPSSGEAFKTGSGSDAQLNTNPEETSSLPAPLETSLEFSNRDFLCFSVIGFLAGFISIMTATGGPFVIVPTTFTLVPKMPPKQVVGMSLTAAVLISASATVYATIFMTVDGGLALAMGVALIIGTPLGVFASKRVSQTNMRIIISTLLVLVGASSLVRVAAG